MLLFASRTNGSSSQKNCAPPEMVAGNDMRLEGHDVSPIWGSEQFAYAIARPTEGQPSAQICTEVSRVESARKAEEIT
jgi:hypothetical protein